MLFRVVLIFICSLGIFLGYEIVCYKHYKDRQIPLAIGFVVVLARLGLVISSFYVAALVTQPFLSTASLGVKRIGVAVAGLFGMWTSSIFLQIGQNVIRSSQGLPLQRIRWIRSRYSQHKK